MVSKSCFDVCSFNILIRGLCRTGKVDGAIRLFNGIKGFGLLPDIITYNTMIDGLFKVKKVDKVRELVFEARSRNEITPTVVTYTSMISGYCKLGRMDEASLLFQEMLTIGIRPTTTTLNVLIDGFGKVGDIASASAMYEKMISLKLQPDVITFTSRIYGYCRIGLVDESLKVLNEMIHMKLSPNGYTFSILIFALCKENRLNEACNLKALESTVGDDNVINSCGGAAVQRALGPFGLLVLADESLSELTPVYFYIAKASDGTVKNWFCTDQSRFMSKAGISIVGTLLLSSIGAFISHCGWNSCIESISIGVPIAAWPMHSDQPRNAILITEVLKIGTTVGDWSQRDEITASNVIENSVKKLMASKEGDEMRTRAVELGESVRRTVAVGGSSHSKMKSFITHITR